MKITAKSLKDATTLRNLLNRAADFHGIRIACVGWHDRMWKVLPPGTRFEEILDDHPNPSGNGTVAPLAQFYYQCELWDYLRAALAEKE